MFVEPEQPILSRRAARTLLALTLCSAGVMAQPRPGEVPPGGRRGPPAEALAACKALKAGDACSFTAERGPAAGTCWAPEGRPLACRPKGAPAPGADAHKPARP